MYQTYAHCCNQISAWYAQYQSATLSGTGRLLSESCQNELHPLHQSQTKGRHIECGGWRWWRTLYIKSMHWKRKCMGGGGGERTCYWNADTTGAGRGAGLLPTPQSIVTLSMRIEIGTDDGYHLAVISAEHIQWCSRPLLSEQLLKIEKFILRKE